MRHRALAAALAAGLLVGGVLLALLLPVSFIPPDDDATTQVTITLPPGSDLHDTAAAAEPARILLGRNRHVHRVYTAIGAGNTGGDPSEAAATSATDVRTAVLTLGLTPRDERPRLRKQAIEQDLRQTLTALPGVRVKVGMGDAGDSYLLVLSGQDADSLDRHAALVARELRTLPGIGTVTSTAGLVRPELTVTPDFACAADLGVTAAAIAETLRVATIGDDAPALPRLNLSERQVPVMVRLNDAARQDLGTLKRLPVPGARGPAALDTVATLAIGSGPSEITRLDRMRAIKL